MSEAFEFNASDELRDNLLGLGQKSVQLELLPTSEEVIDDVTYQGLLKLDPNFYYGAYLKATQQIEDEYFEIMPLNAVDRWSPRDWYETMIAGFKESDFESEVREVRGPWHKQLNMVFSEVDQSLRGIDPRLTPEVLWPKNYQSTEARSLCYDVARQFADLRASSYSIDRLGDMLGDLRRVRRDKLDGILHANDEQLKSQILDSGVLQPPDYFYWQLKDRGCARTCFLMVMADLAQTAIYPSDIDHAYERHIGPLKNGDSVLYDSAYLKMLESSPMQEKLNSSINCISFVGADLAWINNTVKKITDSIERSRVYCVLNILSDTSPGTAEAGIWHNNILLSADEENVYVHDPNKSTGQPYRKLPKEIFYARWVQAQLRGHFIVAKPR